MQVVVDFRGGLFGSFSQWLGFDVGERPVVVRKLNIELGTRLVNQDVRSLREKLQFDRLDTKPFIKHEKYSNIKLFTVYFVLAIWSVFLCLFTDGLRPTAK